MRFHFLICFVVASLLLAGMAKAASPAFVVSADEYLRRKAAEAEFNGVVIVAKDGKPLIRKAYGLANLEWRTPMTVSTKFRIGSTTKQFTAAAVMQLVEAGKVRLDAAVSDYLPDLPGAWSGVTIRQLLDHTSGIPDYTRTNGFIRGPGRMDLRPEELVALVRDKPLASPPGTKFAYNNTGYVLLGIVIERVSGRSYPSYVEERILRPLRLNDTAYDDGQEIVPQRAAGYWRGEDGLLKNARVLTTSAVYASGALRSTADDLLAWEQALHKGALISPSSVQAMFTDYGHGYGFGSFVETRDGRRLWDHGGNVTGFSCAFEQYPDDGLTVIVLTNIEGTGSERIAKDLAGIYFGSAVPEPGRRRN